MNRFAFQVQTLCDLVVLFEKCPQIPRVPVLFYLFWEYNGCNPGERHGEEDGELMEELNVLVLYVFGEKKRPERWDRVDD